MTKINKALIAFVMVIAALIIFQLFSKKQTLTEEQRHIPEQLDNELFKK